MKLSIRYIIFIMVLLFSCSKAEKSNNIESKYLEADIEKWANYADNVGTDNDFSHKLVLVTYPTFCGDCLRELNEWNRRLKVKEFENLDIDMIVVDRFKVSTTNFIDSNEFLFDAKTDTSAQILKLDLIPFIPMKIYFVNDEIIKMDRIGNKPSFDELIKLIKMHQDL